MREEVIDWGGMLQGPSEELHLQVSHVAVGLREQLSISQDPLQEILICQSHPRTNQEKGQEICSAHSQSSFMALNTSC